MANPKVGFRNEKPPHALHEYNDDSMDFIPIIYNELFDIYFFKLELLHPFDCKKWGKIARHLIHFFEKEKNRRINLLSPKRAIELEELKIVHSQEFIKSMTTSRLRVARASEIATLVFVPMCIIRKKLLLPLRWQVAGSVLAGKVALDHGWSINLGGGFHHCSSADAGGFCLFADITLMIRFNWDHLDSRMKIMIVDLDAHQGNGYARDVLNMSRDESRRIYIMDMYNAAIYPRDGVAKEAINRSIELKSRTGTKEYLELLFFHLRASLTDFKPDLVIYNAGTDILMGDPLGRLSITPEVGGCPLVLLPSCNIHAF